MKAGRGKRKPQAKTVFAFSIGFGHFEGFTIFGKILGKIVFSNTGSFDWYWLYFVTAVLRCPQTSKNKFKRRYCRPDDGTSDIFTRAGEWLQTSVIVPLPLTTVLSMTTKPTTLFGCLYR